MFCIPCISTKKRKKKSVVLEDIPNSQLSGSFNKSIDVINHTEISHICNGKHLVCDDASTNRSILIKYLTRYSCICDEAKNGEEAIEKVIENGEYKIIWMDLKMPKYDGIEATKILRSKLNYKGTIIAITGFVDSSTRTTCMNAGINHFLSKPFDPQMIKHFSEEC